MTLVSVIIPTTRRHDLVQRALRSVFAQTHRDLEVVVVIDGPNPITASVLGAIDDPRLTVLQNHPALGAGPARNRGIAAATGDFVAFLDDDDEWLPTKIEAQLGLASLDKPVVVSCQTIVRTPRGEQIWPRTPYDGSLPVDEYLYDRRSFVRGEAFINTSTFLLPRSIAERTGFGDSRNQEDIMLLLRVTKMLGGRVVMVPAPLAVVYKEEDRESIGSDYFWRDMLAWANASRTLMTPRAYSGFCLIYLGSRAAQQHDMAGFFALVRHAFRHGRPTPLQLCLFTSYWLFPSRVRGQLKARFQHLIKRSGRPAAKLNSI